MYSPAAPALVYLLLLILIASPDRSCLPPPHPLLTPPSPSHRSHPLLTPQGEDGTAKKKKKKATGNDFYRVVFKVHQYFEPEASDLAAGEWPVLCVCVFKVDQYFEPRGERLGGGLVACVFVVCVLRPKQL